MELVFANITCSFLYAIYYFLGLSANHEVSTALMEESEDEISSASTRRSALDPTLPVQPNLPRVSLHCRESTHFPPTLPRVQRVSRQISATCKLSCKFSRQNVASVLRLACIHHRTNFSHRGTDAKQSSQHHNNAFSLVGIGLLIIASASSLSKHGYEAGKSSKEMQQEGGEGGQ